MPGAAHLLGRLSFQVPLRLHAASRHICARPPPRMLRTAAPAASAAGAPAGKQAPGSGASLRPLLGAASDQGPRPYMEDRYTMIQGFLSGPFSDFAAVYDGHSGHHGAQHAAMRLHEYIAAQPAIRNARGGADEAAAVEKGLKDAFLQTDEEVVNTAVDKGRRYGTTAVCALRLGGTLYVAHAGDSRAVLCRDSKAVRLTQDHKPASVPEERKRIESQGAGITPQKGGYVVEPSGNRMLNMSRALGDPDFKVPRRLVEAEPDVARVDLRPGSDQFLLLATDGVFDVLSDQEASDIVLGLTASGRLSNDSAEAAADAVCRKAIKAGSRDNVTALVMLFEGSSAASRED